jgi:hypothetical protein
MLGIELTNLDEILGRRIAAVFPKNPILIFILKWDGYDRFHRVSPPGVRRTDESRSRRGVKKSCHAIASEVTMKLEAFSRFEVVGTDRTASNSGCVTSHQ